MSNGRTSGFGRSTSTGLGLLAVIFWGTSFAFARSLMEQVGTITGAALTYTIGGGLGCLWIGLVRRDLGGFLRMPRSYLLICGSMFMVCTVSIELALGFARNRQQVIEVGIINYLWPALTMALSVPLLGRRANWLLAPGVLLGVGGAALAVVAGSATPGGQTGYSVHLLWENLMASPGPYLLAAVAAVSWAIYSNMAHRLAGDRDEPGGVPILLLASGLLIALLLPFVDEPAAWTTRARVELLYTALFPALLAYLFWDIAMRRGRHALVVAFSYLAPLISTVVSCAYLRIAMGWELWAACGMVIAGAVLSNMAVRESSAQPPADALMQAAPADA